jgi:hypothetical protein
MTIDKEYYDLTLTRDGKLILDKWEYDHVAKHGEYIKIDHTSNPYAVLNKTVQIEPGFTLKHLFEIVKADADILNVVLDDCWVEAYIKHYESVKGDAVPCQGYSPDGIEYMRLYWNAELDDSYSGTYIWGDNKPDFDGVGWLLKEDKLEDTFVMYKKDTRINWGLDFSPLVGLLNLSIVADEEFIIRDDIKNWNQEDPSLMQRFECKKKYTLRNVIEGVFWELSFHGTPEDKDTNSAEVTRRYDDAKEYLATGDMSKFVKIDDAFIKGLRNTMEKNDD